MAQIPIIDLPDLPAYTSGIYTAVTYNGQTYRVPMFPLPAQAIPAGSISATQIADLSIGSAKLIDGAVIASKLADGAVTTNALGADAVTTSKIADSAITEDKIANSGVTTSKIADNAVATSKLADLGVTHEKIAADAVRTVNVQDRSITTPKLADGAVTPEKMSNSNFIDIGLDWSNHRFFISTPTSSARTSPLSVRDNFINRTGTQICGWIAKPKTGQVVYAITNSRYAYQIGQFDANGVITGGLGLFWTTNTGQAAIDSVTPNYTDGQTVPVGGDYTLTIGNVSSALGFRFRLALRRIAP